MASAASVYNSDVVAADFPLFKRAVAGLAPQAVIATAYFALAVLNFIDEVLVVDNKVANQAVLILALASAHFPTHTFHVLGEVFSGYILLRVFVHYGLTLKGCNGRPVENLLLRAGNIISCFRLRAAKLGAQVLLVSGTSNRHVFAHQVALRGGNHVRTDARAKICLGH